MNAAILALALAVGTALASWILTRWVTAALKRRAVLDMPNERSSHTAPTPRGGGIGLLGAALPLMALIVWLHTPGDLAAWAALGAAVALGAISWIDDLGHLPVTLRLGAHVIAVAVILAFVPAKLLAFQGLLPMAADFVAVAVLWVWFVNLFNFMDGIDGIAGVETVSIGIGTFAVTLLMGTEAPGAAALGLAALVVASAAAGFLVLNWHPARVFLGDVGAVPLGLLLGFFLVTLAQWGYWAAALILPAYYLADASITIVRRALKREPVWRAHAQHFYQRAVQRGMSHARVARFVAFGNAALVLLACLSVTVASLTGELLCFGGALLITGYMLLWLARAAPGQ